MVKFQAIFLLFVSMFMLIKPFTIQQPSSSIEPPSASASDAMEDYYDSGKFTKTFVDNKNSHLQLTMYETTHFYNLQKITTAANIITTTTNLHHHHKFLVTMKSFEV